MNADLHTRYFVYPDKIILADEEEDAQGWIPGSPADFRPWIHVQAGEDIHPLSELDADARQEAVEMRGFNGEEDNLNLAVYALPDEDVIAGYKGNPNCFMRMSLETYIWLEAVDVELWANLYGMTLEHPTYAKMMEAISEPIDEGIYYNEKDEWE